MSIDPTSCYAALSARDPRFDGVFFVGVTTTGIYCRPVCTAKTPGASRCRYYRSAPEAERDGFRACFRCRPELAPGVTGVTSVAAVDAVSRLVADAVAAIDEGALNTRSVDALAKELGVSGRHLRRATQRELGVSPLDLAQSRRLAVAKRLLHDTALPITDVAIASGFRSLRRFNAAFVGRFGRSPTSLRQALGRAPSSDSTLSLRLDYRDPFAWEHLLGFLRRRAVPGVESASGDRYARVLSVGDATGVVSVTRDPARPSLRAALSPSLTPHVMPVVAMLRRLFDLDAHPDRIAERLSTDPLLAPLLRERPGLRVPGSVDCFETGARALLGQQVSVSAATTLAGRLVERFGVRVSGDAVDGLTHAFPSAKRLSKLAVEELASIGLPRSRAEALRGFAKAVAEGDVALNPRGDTDALLAALQDLPGIGPWTAEYIAMRGLHLPDAFPAGDLGVRKALGGVSAAEARERSEGWGPWRSYAVMHLWTSLGGVVR